jgi:hypothetical protein
MSPIRSPRRAARGPGDKRRRRSTLGRTPSHRDLRLERSRESPAWRPVAAPKPTRAYMRKTPSPRSSSGALAHAASASARTRRVSRGSMMRSSQSGRWSREGGPAARTGRVGLAPPARRGWGSSPRSRSPRPAPVRSGATTRCARARRDRRRDRAPRPAMPRIAGRNSSTSCRHAVSSPPSAATTSACSCCRDSCAPRTPSLRESSSA